MHSRTDSARPIEAVTMARVNRRLLPFLFLLYVVCFIDRTNVSFAALQMNRDVGFSDAVYGLGAGVFFLGYALFEVPSNLVLARVGARRWIGRIAITWGILAVGMLFVRSSTSFLVMRFLLGVAEAGYFPGIIYYLSLWFPERHLARATSRLMVGIPLASAIGGPVGGLLLGLDGKLGLAGWQWLFLVEGLPAVVLGVIALRYGTDRVDDAPWLPGEGRSRLRARLDAEKLMAQDRAHTRLREVFSSGKVGLLILTYFLFCVILYGLTLWLPLMIRDQLGLENVAVGLVIGLLGLCGAASMLLNSLHSDKTGERVLHTAIPAAISAGMVAIAAVLGTGLVPIVALMVAVIALNGMGPTFWCLPRAVLQGTAAAGGIALINAIGNLGGFAGPNVLGVIKESTGSYSVALLILAAGGFIAAGLLLRLRSVMATVN
jgi:ACS family tartrate transporter-like MFS transporter